MPDPRQRLHVINSWFATLLICIVPAMVIVLLRDGRPPLAVGAVAAPPSLSAHSAVAVHDVDLVPVQARSTPAAHVAPVAARSKTKAPPARHSAKPAVKHAAKPAATHVVNRVAKQPAKAVNVVAKTTHKSTPKAPTHEVAAKTTQAGTKHSAGPAKIPPGTSHPPHQGTHHGTHGATPQRPPADHRRHDHHEAHGTYGHGHSGHGSYGHDRHRGGNGGGRGHGGHDGGHGHHRGH